MSNSQDFRQPALCKITVDGEEITELLPYMVEATVETARTEAAVCTLVFDTFRQENDSWIIQDADVFIPWKKFKIEADFGDYVEEVMRGYIKEVRADTPESMGDAKVIVYCQDESILLDREHIRKAWSREDETMTDGEVVNEIASHDFNVEYAEGLTNISLNQDATSVRFIRERAKANGFEFYVREGTVYFKPPQLDEEPQGSLMVYMGERSNCIRVSIQHDGHRPDKVGIHRAAATGIEADQETFTPNLTVLGTSAASSENMGLSPFVWQLTNQTGSSLEEVRARAQAKVNEQAWKVIAEGELDSALYGHVLLTHKPVGVYGIGDTYSGLYYVDKVTHIFSQEGYRQSFRLLRNATGQNSEPETNDSLAAVR